MVFNVISKSLFASYDFLDEWLGMSLSIFDPSPYSSYFPAMDGCCHGPWWRRCLLCWFCVVNNGNGKLSTWRQESINCISKQESRCFLGIISFHLPPEIVCQLLVYWRHSAFLIHIGHTIMSSYHSTRDWYIYHFVHTSILVCFMQCLSPSRCAPIATEDYRIIYSLVVSCCSNLPKKYRGIKHNQCHALSMRHKN